MGKRQQIIHDNVNGRTVSAPSAHLGRILRKQVSSEIQCEENVVGARAGNLRSDGAALRTKKIGIDIAIAGTARGNYRDSLKTRSAAALEFGPDGTDDSLDAGLRVVPVYRRDIHKDSRHFARSRF
jgi:hypothetical protein